VEEAAVGADSPARHCTTALGRRDAGLSWPAFLFAPIVPVNDSLKGLQDRAPQDESYIITN
jgi:hypothetical protein